MSKEEKNANDPLEAKLIRSLAGILEETGLSEIEIEKQGLRVRVARTLQITAAAMAPMAAAPSAAAGGAPKTGGAPAKADLSSHPGLVASPMVGTAYVAPSPGTPPFVKVGDMVTDALDILDHRL